MEKAKQDGQNKLKSYQRIMRILGVSGILLPLIVIGYNHVSEVVDKVPETERLSMMTSISQYYYSGARNPFVGILFILGITLVTYKGDRPTHDWWATTAGVFAISIALFPCRHSLKDIHFGSAVGMFAIFSLFCIRFFREESPSGIEVPASNRKFYLISGLAILLGLVVCAFFFIKHWGEDYESPVIFFAEAWMLLFFGLSWLRKAEESDPYLKLLFTRRKSDTTEETDNEKDHKRKRMQA